MDIMPNPRGSEAPYFNGEDVTDFLRNWEHLCEDRGKPLDSMLSRIPNYCDPVIALHTRYLTDKPGII
jgi:hypothetical protein